MTKVEEIIRIYPERQRATTRTKKSVKCVDYDALHPQFFAKTTNDAEYAQTMRRYLTYIARNTVWTGLFYTRSSCLGWTALYPFNLMRDFTMKQPAVYILSSQRNGTLYVGVTADLIKRIWQHREGLVEGFTRRYNVKTLVWYELHATMYNAITREKSMKKWNREWKLRLIETTNPHWQDLWPRILGLESPK